MPRETEQRRNADRTGDKENRQHLTPRNQFSLLTSLRDKLAETMRENRTALLRTITPVPGRGAF
jgi:hypothetical protein